MLFKREVRDEKKLLGDFDRSKYKNLKINSKSFYELVNLYLDKSGEGAYIKLGICGEFETNDTYKFNVAFSTIKSQYTKSEVHVVNVSKNLSLELAIGLMIQIINRRIKKNYNIRVLSKANHSKFFKKDLSCLDQNSY